MKGINSMSYAYLKLLFLQSLGYQYPKLLIFQSLGHGYLKFVNKKMPRYSVAFL